jgi:hypothetical protein
MLITDLTLTHTHTLPTHSHTHTHTHDHTHVHSHTHNLTHTPRRRIPFDADGFGPAHLAFGEDALVGETDVDQSKEELLVLLEEV